jgi:hypothetical protein
MGARFHGLYLPPPSRPDKPLAVKTLIIPTQEYSEGRSVMLTTGRSSIRWRCATWSSSAPIGVGRLFRSSKKNPVRDQIDVNKSRGPASPGPRFVPG